jgi:tetratricopeptide (TPR) repeat protein
MNAWPPLRRGTQAPRPSLDNTALNRALLALAKHQPQQAIDVLAPLQRGQADINAAPFRALAYMELKKPAEAAIEFRKGIARKSQSLNLRYARRHVQLARALAAAGNVTEAKKTYDAFFTLWKDADPGIPLLDAAHKEYAALN